MFVFWGKYFCSPEKLFLIILSLHYSSNVENEGSDPREMESLLGGGTSRGKYNGFI